MCKGSFSLDWIWMDYESINFSELFLQKKISFNKTAAEMRIYTGELYR
jgi:hypothetical protein